MKKRNKIILLLIIIIFFIISFFFFKQILELSNYKKSSISISKSMPLFLVDKIKNHNYNLETVYKCIYKKRTVYLIVPGCCDQFISLYSKIGFNICNPSGGFTGKGDGICSDFYRSRTDCVVIWKNK